MAQSTISHCEAGQPARAVDILQQRLARRMFAPRDRAFFTAYLSSALATAGEPDQAATTGPSALRLAAGQALRSTCSLRSARYARVARTKSHARGTLATSPGHSEAGPPPVGDDPPQQSALWLSCEPDGHLLNQTGP
ncbi:hypothetical protein OHA84_36485 [Streptomyces sp. NBC_00513]|uniref:hypothetical protein n=1 Tax=unclassified Streptomyces TaxID=2593676 RepID=UPI002259248A|nr:hypothetical protein [Streptomyces sp. NBC_00424]MCX5070999.1 hypothetical protein [Streptomyces sp. NBC_00424]WUD45566.1 hypothetical protein OHA84_36485 [Streptomyces sp. NBC_00513]